MLGVLLLGMVLHSYADPAQGQTAILVIAVALSACGNVLALFLRIKPKTRPPAKLSDAVQCLRSRAGRYLVLLSIATYLGWGLLLSSFASLVRDIGQDAKLQWIVLPYYAGRLVVAWIAGHTSDKVGRERVMLSGFALGTSSLVAAALWPTAPVIAAVSAVLGMQAAMVSVSSTAAVGDYVREDERHLIFAGTNAWGYLATGLTMIGSQLLRQRYESFAPSFLLFAGFYGVCALLVVRMRKALNG
jgi:MFS family permease